MNDFVGGGGIQIDIYNLIYIILFFKNMIQTRGSK